MTREQLIQAMALFGFQEITDYTIDQDYESIVMVAPEAQKPSEEQLQVALDNEIARLAEELAAEQEAQRLNEINLRLQILPDLASLLDLYIKANEQQKDEDDSFNLVGFEDATKLESDFGWNFKNIPKPSIDDLEALVSTKQAADLENIWNSLRKQRNQKLAECDFTQLSDAPLTSEEKQAWATYRQALRDLPANTQDPSNPSWPSQPE